MSYLISRPRLHPLVFSPLPLSRRRFMHPQNECRNKIALLVNEVDTVHNRRRRRGRLIPRVALCSAYVNPTDWNMTVVRHSKTQDTKGGFLSNLPPPNNAPVRFFFISEIRPPHCCGVHVSVCCQRQFIWSPKYHSAGSPTFVGCFLP